MKHGLSFFGGRQPAGKTPAFLCLAGFAGLLSWDCGWGDDPLGCGLVLAAGLLLLFVAVFRGGVLSSEGELPRAPFLALTAVLWGLFVLLRVAVLYRGLARGPWFLPSVAALAVMTGLSLGACALLSRVLLLCGRAAAPERALPPVGAEKRRDRMAAAILAGGTGLLCFFALNRGHDWGADFSVYMAEGIALAQGRFPELCARFGQLSGTSVVYVWGFPLLLAPVYALVGFARTDFHEIIYYKIPGCLSLVLLALLLYRFYRKRFGRRASFLLTALFAWNTVFISYTNQILTDLPFLLASTGCLLLLGRWGEDFESGGRARYGRCALLGAAIFAAQMIRDCGAALLALLAIAQGVKLLGLRRKRRGPDRGELLCLLLPWALYLALYTQVRRWLPYGNVPADLNFDPNYMLWTYYIYARQLRLFFGGFLAGTALDRVFWALSLCLAAFGAWKNRRQEYLSAAYLAGTFLAMGPLPRAGLRYLFMVLPLLVLFWAYGALALLRFFRSGIARGAAARKFCTAAFALAVLLTVLTNTVDYDRANMAAGRAYDRETYSREAVSLWHYIRDETDEDAVFCFFKARGLLLNADRTGTWYPEEVGTGDYILLCADDGYGGDLETFREAEGIESLSVELVWDSASFRMYRLTAPIVFAGERDTA